MTHFVPLHYGVPGSRILPMTEGAALSRFIINLAVYFINANMVIKFQTGGLMTRIRHVAVFAGLFLLLPACTKSAPKCSDDATVRTVVVEFKKWAGYDKEPSVLVHLETIRTIGVDKDTGCQSCCANLVIENSNEPSYKHMAPLWYKSELTDRGEHVVSLMRDPQ